MHKNCFTPLSISPKLKPILYGKPDLFADIFLVSGMVHPKVTVEAYKVSCIFKAKFTVCDKSGMYLPTSIYRPCKHIDRALIYVEELD